MEPIKPTVTPEEVAVNPLVSGLNSPVLSQGLLKGFVAVMGIAASLVGLQVAEPDVAAMLPEKLFQGAKILVALGAALAPLFPGWRQKADVAGKEAAAKVVTVSDAAAVLSEIPKPEKTE